MEKLSRTIELSIMGIQLLVHWPDILEPIQEIFETDQQMKMRGMTLEAFEEDAAYALDEVNKDFPFLLCHWVVSYWALLENLIHTLIANWIINKPSVLTEPSFRNLRVRISEYESLDTETKSEFLTDLLDRNLSGPMKKGINRFETLLEAIGLGGNVPEDLRRVFFEFQQVRNLIAHRLGIVDNKFINDCPWKNATVGEQYALTREDVSVYIESGLEYIFLIINRLNKHFDFVESDKNDS
jgi:hypothetical protein